MFNDEKNLKTKNTPLALEYSKRQGRKRTNVGQV